MSRRIVPLALVGLTVFAQISYPLVAGPARTTATLVTVCLGFAAAVCQVAATRGALTTALVVLVTAGGGWLAEAAGTASGVPFGSYAYTRSLGPTLGGVPWVIPMAWTMMAWPAWLVAGRLTSGRRRILVAGWALASWDLFLDPQMVAAGHWVWKGGGGPGLPGVAGIPWTNYAGWLVIAVGMAAVLRWVPAAGGDVGEAGPMFGFYLWTYLSSVLAQAAFFDLPASACWGGLGMGLVAVPLLVTLYRSADRRRWPMIALPLRHGAR